MTSNLRSQTKKTSKKFPVQNLPNNLPKQNWRKNITPKNPPHTWNHADPWKLLEMMFQQGLATWVRVSCCDPYEFVSTLDWFLRLFSDSDSKRESQQKWVDQRFDVSKFMKNIPHYSCLSKKDNHRIKKTRSTYQPTSSTKFLKRHFAPQKKHPVKQTNRNPSPGLVTCQVEDIAGYSCMDRICFQGMNLNISNVKEHPQGWVTFHDIFDDALMVWLLKVFERSDFWVLFFFFAVFFQKTF